MADRRIEKLARLFVEYSVLVKPKQKVKVERTSEGFPLIQELFNLRFL